VGWRNNLLAHGPALSESRRFKQGNDVIVKTVQWGSSAVAVLASTAAFATTWRDTINMPTGVSTYSGTIYNLHMLALWVCVVIALLVFGAIGYSTYSHRRTRRLEPARFHENTRLEIVWTIIPMAILIGLAYPATVTMIELWDTRGAEMEIEVRGYQWRWQYKYLDENRNEALEFFSGIATTREQIEGRQVKGEHYLLEVDNPLVIPVNRKIRFLLTANDVIHAWWIPDFGLKRDAIPGILNEAWVEVTEPGIYRGMCAEFCGRDHAFMPIVVHAVTQDEFDVWYAEQQEIFAERLRMVGQTFEPEQLMTMGSEVYRRFCASCHGVEGRGVPPIFPALARSPVSTGPREELVRIIYYGVPGTAMQAFGGQLNAAELAAVTHYVRNAWGNDAGDVTQPADILDMMEGQ
jgi:cytochrome c oxidase subunit II